MSRNHRRNRLGVESLEGRDLPSISLVGGVLSVFGDDPGYSVDDVITLDRNATDVQITHHAVTTSCPAASINRIDVRSLTGNDTVNVERMFAFTPVNVYTGTGSNSVNLSPYARDLDNLPAPVTVTDQGGYDLVVLNDRSDTSENPYRVTDTAVTPAGNRPLFAGLNYSGIDALFLYTGDQRSGVTLIDRTASGTNYSISGGASSDTVIVGAGNLDLLRGHVSVYGNADVDTVYVQDELVNYSDTYTLSSNGPAYNLDRPFFAGLTFSSTLERLHVIGERGNNRFNVQTMPVVTNVELDGNGGVDTIAGPNAPTTWTLRGNADSMVGNVSFRAAEILQGGSMADVFNFQSSSQASSALDGGGGADTLNYSAFLSGVYVDLAAGSAPMVTGVVSAVENVIGSAYDSDQIRGDGVDNYLSGLGGDDVIYGGAGNDTIDGGADCDILFGQAGNDTMYGGARRDILFGGVGADTMYGGADDDILASGTTTFENDLAALAAIQTEWCSAHTYWDRVWNIHGNAANSTTFASRWNGNYFLVTAGSGATVIQPSATEDTMTGGMMTPSDPNHDWFFGHAGEYIDREAGEAVNA